jgi:hypothetical protein
MQINQNNVTSQEIMNESWINYVKISNFVAYDYLCAHKCKFVDFYYE